MLSRSMSGKTDKNRLNTNSLNDEFKKLSVLLPKRVHKNLKRLALEQDTSVTSLITQMIVSALEETTQEASSNQQPLTPSEYPNLDINLDDPQSLLNGNYPAA